MNNKKDEKENVPRIIFQPTKENREKLLHMSEISGLSLSAVINAILNTVEDIEINVNVINNNNSDLLNKKIEG